MIYDTKENLAKYKGLSKNLDEAINYLMKTDLKNAEAGTYKIDGDHVFAMVQNVETRPREQGCWEAHENFIDIQYIIQGEESIGVQKLDELTVSDPYNAEKDIVFYEENGKGFFPQLTPNAYMILFPTDAHLPLVCTAKPQPVKKVIVKIEVE